MARGKDYYLDNHNEYFDKGCIDRITVLKDASLEVVEQLCGVMRELNKMLDTFQKQA